MGAALILPVVAVIFVVAIWAGYAAARTARERRAHQTLPDDPYARREEELRRLRQEHAEASPQRTTHPARRP